jgi:Na+/melibiose symporter-like transporter
MASDLSDAGGRLPRRAVAGYALGSLGTGVYSTVPTVLLLFYCTEILQIPPAIAAAIVFAPKAWAVLWDPIVGTASDRSRSVHGRRAPFILAGAAGVTVSFALLFNAPPLSMTGTVLYVAAAYFLLASSYSVFAVPYVAVPAEISPLPAERERLTSWRMTFAMAGVLIGAGAAPMLAVAAGGGRRGYGTMALIVALVCGIATLGAWWTIRRDLK